MSTIRRVLGGALFHVPHPAPERGAAPDDSVPSGARLAAVTAVSGAALFLLGVNTTGIDTALRAIAADLGVGTGALSWAVGAYMPAVAAVVVPGGGSATCWASGSPWWRAAWSSPCGAVVVAASGSEAALVAGRVLQGVGAAALMPSTMAVLRLRASGIINVVRYVTAALAVSAGSLVFLARGIARVGEVLREAGLAGPGTVAADRLLSGAVLPAEQAAGPLVREAFHRATAAGLAHGFAGVMFSLGVLSLAAIPLWLLLPALRTDRQEARGDGGGGGSGSSGR